MKREFNLTGVCVQKLHYMADTTPQINEIFETLIERGKYFTITGGRQFGKTTTISLIYKELIKLDDYLLIRTSFEGVGDTIYKDEKKFSEHFLMNLYYDTKLRNEKIAEEFKVASKKMMNFKTLSDFITDFSEKKQKKIILIIDEVDKSLNNQIFLSFLGLLRDKYLLRKEDIDYTFHSIILAGVHDIKTIKIKLSEGEEEKLNSPWNIASNFDIDLSFRPHQIVTLLEDYLSEHPSIKIPKKDIAEKIYFYTHGYPFLVSLMCYIIAEKIIKKRESKNWTLEDVESAFEMIVYPGYTTTLFDSISKNLINNQKLYKFISDIIIDNMYKPFALNNPNVLLANAYGIIKDNKGSCVMHNHIFEQRLYDLMLSIHLDNSDSKILALNENFYKNNNLNFEFILQRFQKFFKENYSHDNESFIEKEGRLIFLSYLQPIINSSGYVFKEPVVGDNRRMDLVITHNKKRYVVELKIWRGEKYHKKGLKQLSDYMDIYSIKKGYLLIFNFNKNKQFKKELIKFEDKKIYTVWT